MSTNQTTGTTRTDEQHKRAAREIIAAMVKHPIHRNGLPQKDINAGFHPKMVEPIWNDINAEIIDVHTNTSTVFDTTVTLSIPYLHQLRNTRYLDLYDFEPTFYTYKPVDYGVYIMLGGSYNGQREYGFRIYMGDIDFDEDEN